MSFADKSEVTLWLISPFVGAVIFASSLLAQTLTGSVPENLPPVESIVSVDKSTYRLDEEIHYRLAIRWREKTADIQWRFPPLPVENLKILGVVESVETQREGENEFRERILSYKLKPIKPGRASVGSFFFEYGQSGMDSLERVRIGALVFEIKPIRKLTDPFSFGIITLAALGTLCALVALIQSRLSQRDQHDNQREEQSFEEKCVAQLTDLSHLLNAQCPKEYIDRSSGVLRNYLRQRFQFSDPGLGGLELCDQIERRRDIPSDEKRKIRVMIERLNECQFAGMEPTIEEAKKINREIAEIITQQKVV